MNVQSAKISATDQEAKGPLRGVRVLDIATMLGAGHCTSLLADFGAEVIHVELPGRGDSLRGMGPFKNKLSLRWAVVGRGKKSITVDMRTEKGQRLIQQLIPTVDVVVENYRPGTIAKWGLGFDDLKKLNPDIVLLSLSGYGQTGPKSHLPGFGRVIEAASGWMNQTGEADGPPMQMGVPAVDYIAGTFGAMAISMALYDKVANAGKGQWIDLSLYESVVRLLDSLVTRYGVLGEVPHRMGNRYLNVAPSDVFRTKDGRYVFHSSATQTVYERLMKAIGRTDLITDEKYATNTARTAKCGDVNDIVQAWFDAHDLAEVMRIMDEHDVPCSPVNTMEEVAADDQLLERESLVRLPFAGVGDVLMPGLVPKFSATPGAIRHIGPAIGEHTREVLATSLGLSADELDKLSRDGVI
jgi:formyl-CoA transferase